VIGIAGIHRRRERRLRRVITPFGRARQQQIDGVGYQLDVTEFLGGNIGNEIVEGPHFAPAAKVERLERVVHERGHLAELPAKQLLDRGRGVGRRVLRMRKLSLAAYRSA
jgi:hypothetical protein